MFSGRCGLGIRVEQLSQGVCELMAHRLMHADDGHFFNAHARTYGTYHLTGRTRLRMDRQERGSCSMRVERF